MKTQDNSYNSYNLEANTSFSQNQLREILKAQRFSSSTIKNYLADINHLTSWYETEFKKPFSPQGLTPQMLDQFREYLSKDGHSARTVNRHFSSIRSLFKVLKKEGLVTKDPTEKKELPVKEDSWHLKQFKDYLYVFGAADLTIKNYILDIQHFLDWVEKSVLNGDFNLSEEYRFSKLPKHLPEYQKRVLESKGYSLSSVKRKLSSIRKYLSWAAKEGYLKELPSFQQPRVVSAPPPKPLSPPPSEEWPSLKPSISPLSFLGAPLRLFKRFISPLNLLFENFLITPLANLAKNKTFYAPPKRSFRAFKVPVIIIVILVLTGFTAYQLFFKKEAPSGTTLTPGQPGGIVTIGKNRTFPFAGKLTDSKGIPITKPVSVYFGLFSSETSKDELWQETSQIIPDREGKFSVLLGEKASLPASVFIENESLWLGLKVEKGEELKPRQQIPNVDLTRNSLYLRGALPGTQAGPNMVPILDSNGNLNLAAKSPSITSTSGTFTLMGETLYFDTIENGNIIFAPGGLGGVDVQKTIFNTTDSGSVPGAVEISDTLSIISTSSGQPAVSIRQDGAGDLLSAFFATEATDSAQISTQSAFIIKNTGLVGIGTSAPTRKLEVAGDIGMNGNLYFTAGDLAFINKNATEAARLTEAGKFGLGITSPTSKLHVKGAVPGKALIIFDETGDQNIFVASASGTTKLTLSRTGNLALEGEISNISGETVTINDSLKLLAKNLTTNQTTFNLVNDTATTVNFAGASTTLSIGATSGTTTVNNALAVTGNTALTGDLAVNGGDLTTTSTTFNLLNEPTTLNIGSTAVARTINLGIGTLADTINIGTGGTTADTINIGTAATANTIAIGSTSTTGLSLTDDNWNVSVAGAANFVSIGATTPGSGVFTTLTSSGNTTLGTGASGAHTYSTGAGSTTTLGNSTGALTIASGGTSAWTNTAGNLTISTATSGTLALDSAGALNIGPTNATSLAVGRSGVTTTINGTVNLAGGTASRFIVTDASKNLAFSAASSVLASTLDDETGTGVAVFSTSPQITTSLTTDSTSFSLINITAATVNFAGAATTLSIGASTGTTTVNNALTITGALTANGTSTFNTDVDMAFAGTENLSLTSSPTANAGTTTDSLQITLTTPAHSAAGTNVHNALDLDATLGNATAGTNTANIINIGTITGDAEVTLNAIQIGALTGTGATEYALSIGSGWDSVLRVNGTEVINGSGQVIAGQITGNLFAITDSTTTEQIQQANTITFADGTDINAVVSATDTVTINNTSTLATVTGRGATTTTLVNLDGGIAVDTSNFTVSGTTGDVLTAGDLAVNGGDLTTTAATFNLLNAATTLNIGSTAVTRAINIGTGTSADTINIGTGATSADAITFGNTGVATTIDINSGAATVNAVDIAADSVSSANALAISSNGLTTGNALSVSSTSTAGGASGASYLLNLSRSGVNTNLAHTAYGIYSAVTNTNITSGTNIGGYFSASGATTANYGLLVANGSVGIGDTTPDAQLEVLSTTEQLRLTYTDGTVDSRFTVDSSGNLTINNTGTKTIISDDLQINGGDILDSNGNEFLRFTVTASAINELAIANAAASGTVTLAATGGDTNIPFSIDSKGSGALNLNNNATGDVLIAGGSGTTGCTVANSTGNLTCTGDITSSGGGTVGYWTRATTTLSPATANDVVSISSNAATNPVLSLTASGTTTGNAASITANALTTGNALSVSSTSTAGGASGASYLLNLSRSGVNTNLAHTAYGIYSAVTNTNATSSTNTAAYLTASGATTANYALYVNAGNVNLQPLAASAFVVTDSSKNLSTTAGTVASSALSSILSDETGSGVAVFATSPQITTSLTTDSTTFALLNTTAATINFGGAATTALNIGNGSGTITNIGNAGGATAINLTSGTGSQTFTSSVATGTTTTSAFVFSDSALTSGTGIYATLSPTTGKGIDLVTSSLTSGTALAVTASSNGLTSGQLLNLTSAPTAATGTSVTADIANFSFSPTYSTAVTTPAISGQVLDISRSSTTNSLFASTLTVSGAVVSISDSSTQTTGTLTHTANVLLVDQNYSSATGVVLSLENAGTGSGIALSSSSTGVLATLDSTGAVTTADGLLIRATNASGVITDAIDVSDAEIVNAINVGDNVILGLAASIDFSEFDVSGTTGSITINDTGDAGQVSVEGTVFDINSLDFVGAGLLTTGAATNLTFTPGTTGDLVFSTDSDTVATFDGSAEGTANVTLTAGDLTISDGDLILSGGEISATADDTTGTSFSFTGVNTTGDTMGIVANSLTTGTALALSSTATSFNGELLTLSKTGASGSTAFTSDIANITYSQTFNAAPGDSTGNVLDISRAITVDDGTAGAITGTVSGALVTLSDNCTAGTADTCTNNANVLSLTQSYASATGAVLNIANSGTGADILFNTSPILRMADGGTMTWDDGTNTLMSLTDSGTGGTLTVSIINTFTAGGNIDMGGNIISNIGSTATDFTTSGALAIGLDAAEANGALYVNNVSQTSPILTLTDNATTVFQVADGGLMTINPVTTGTIADYTLATEWTTGTMINAGYASATTLTGNVTGVSLNFNSSVTPGAGRTIKGMDVQTPALTQTDTSTSAYTGYQISAAGALVQNTLAGTINWRGLDIQMPNITQTTGTVKSIGLNITGGTVTSGTSYGLIIDANAGNVGIGTTGPSHKLTIAGGSTGGVDALHIDGSSSGAGIVINNTAASGGWIQLYNRDSQSGELRIRTGSSDTDVMTITSTGNVGIGTTGPSAALHLKAGTATASTAPLKFTSGTLLTIAEAGAMEFLTDAYYGTITTGAARRTFAFLESPTFTGTVTIPTPFTLGAVSVTATGTQLNYLNAATGTTGTTNTNLVFSTSPTLVTPAIGVATGTSLDLGGTTLYASRAITVDTGGVFNIVLASAAGDDFTVDTDKLVVEGDTGNVGIGTTGPRSKFDIMGPTQTAAQVDWFVTIGHSGEPIATPNYAGAGIKFKAGNPAVPDAKWAGINSIYYGASSNEVGLDFYTTTAGNVLATPSMRIQGNGNVGIGLTNPAYKLQIGNVAGAGIRIGETASAGFDYDRGSGDFYLGGENTQAGNFYIKDSTAVTKVAINSDASSYFMGGNVGIGTTAPNGLLQVSNTTSATWATSGNATGKLIVGKTVDTVLAIGSTASGYVWMQSQAADAANVTYPIAMQPLGGNVGIGTTSPGAKLQVAGDAWFSAQTNDAKIQTLSGKSFGGRRDFYTWSDATWGYTGIGQDTYTSGANTLSVFAVGSGTTLPQISFITGNETGSAYGTRMIITNAGNVGIGTTGPSHILTIAGGSTGGVDALHIDGSSSGAGIVINNTAASGGWIQLYNRDSQSGELRIRTGSSTTDVMTITSTGNVTIGTLGTGANYYVCASAAGLLSEATSCSGSSVRFKKDIGDLNLGLDVLKQLRPVTYKWKDDYRPEDQTPQLGFIAEEVEQIDPMLVFYKDGQIQGIKYDQLTALLTKAIQEQQEEISTLRQEATEWQASLQSQISNLAQQLTSNLLVTNKLISPVAEIDLVRTNLISPVAQDSTIALSLKKDKIEILDTSTATPSAVVSFDNQGNATFSGELTAKQLDSQQLTTDEATISGILRAGKIVADEIDGLEARLSTVSAQYITNNYTVVSPTPTPEVSLASPSASNSFTSGVNTENLDLPTFPNGLMAFGPVSVYDLSVAGNFYLGTNLVFSASTTSLDTLGTDLNIQGLKQGGIAFIGGLVYIDIEGNLKVGGNAEFAKDVTVRGNLAVNIISPLPDNDLVIKLATSNEQLATSSGSLIVKNASDSAVLAINQQGDLTASGSGTFAKLNLFSSPVLALSDTEVQATSSAGQATLKTNQQELTIKNPLVTDKSLIYVTPVASPSAEPLYLLRQTPQESFTVGVSSPANTDLPFNWLIIN